MQIIKKKKHKYLSILESKEFFLIEVNVPADSAKSESHAVRAHTERNSQSDSFSSVCLQKRIFLRQLTKIGQFD